MARPAGPPPPIPAALRHADLAFYGSNLREVDLRPWLIALTPRRRYILPAGDLGGGRARMGRRLAGRSIGVVLSGGGARGFAHLGVLAELASAGVPIDRIGGVSMGAIVAGLMATGMSADEAGDHLKREFVDSSPLNDYTLPLVAITRGRKGRRMIDRLFGSVSIEQLEIDYFCISCDLLANEVITHREGPLAAAVAASVALPGFVPPVSMGQRLLVDGGVLDNLPVERMARDEGPVVGVNVTATAGAAPPRDPGFGRASPRPLAVRLRRRITGTEDHSLTLFETIMRSIVLGSADANAAGARHADYLIAPEVTGVDMRAWARMEEMRARGAEAARSALHGPLAGLRGTAGEGDGWSVPHRGADGAVSVSGHA